MKFCRYLATHAYAGDVAVIVSGTRDEYGQAKRQRQLAAERDEPVEQNGVGYSGHGTGAPIRRAANHRVSEIGRQAVAKR